MRRIAGLALENALELHGDSVILWMHGSYGSAIALSVLAAEEVGKSAIAQDFVWHSAVDGPQDFAFYLQAMYKHPPKQGHFLHYLFGLLPMATFLNLSGGALERAKQHALYVGYPRDENERIDAKERVRSPQNTGRTRAARQITLVSDLLLHMCVGVASGSWEIEVDELRKWLHLPNARWLRRIWPPVGKATRRYIRRAYPLLFEVEKRREQKLAVRRDGLSAHRWKEAYRAMCPNPAELRRATTRTERT